MKSTDGADADDFVALQLPWVSSVFLQIMMSAQRIRQNHQVDLELAAQLLGFKMLRCRETWEFAVNTVPLHSFGVLLGTQQASRVCGAQIAPCMN